MSNGLFTVHLNEEGEFSIDAFTGEARWLLVEVKCGGETEYTPLTPRQELTATSYALSLRPGAQVRGSIEDEGVLIGTNTATGSNSRGLAGYSDNGQGTFGMGLWGVYGRSLSTDGHGVHGDAAAASGTTYGVYGQSYSSEGYGVYGTAPVTGTAGIATATSGTTYGVYGSSDSATGAGVYGTAPIHGIYGEADATAGRGVLGWATSTSGQNRGVKGQSDSNQGTGVYGVATNSIGTTYGVYGEANSGTGYGVYGTAPTIGTVGIASAATGYTYGVYGESSSSAGYGVYGEAPARGVYGYATDTSGITHGVVGKADSPDSWAVYGTATHTTGSNVGVRGESASSSGTGVWAVAPANGVVGHATKTSGTNYGVYGRTDSSSGYGVFSAGDYGGTGAKYAVVQTKDYGWRHLSVMESPEVWFEDFGQAQLVNGQAVVAIEPIFAQTVNLSETYHVFFTPLGDCGLYVAEKTPASFTVQTLGGQTCNIAFDYRIIAKRLGYEENRLEPAADPNQLTQEMGQMETQQEGP